MNRKNFRQKRSQKIYELSDIHRKRQIRIDLKEMEGHYSSDHPDANLCVHKAIAELLLGLSNKAVESAKQAIAMDETSFMGWYILGCAYLDEHKFSYARGAYEKALEYITTKEEEIENCTATDDIFDNLELIANFENWKEKS